MANPRFAWGLNIITGDNDEIDVDIDAVNDVVAIAQGTYRWLGDGSGDDMALALKTALETHGNLGVGETFTVSIDDDGLVTINYSDNVDVDLNWSAVATTVTPSWFGRKSAVETFTGAGAGSVGDYLAGGTWYPDIPAIDDTIIPLIRGSHFECNDPNGETTEEVFWKAIAFRFDWVWGIRVLQDLANQGAYARVYHPSGADGALDPNIAFESLWKHLWKRNETYQESGVYYYPSGGSTPQEGPYYMWGTRYDMREFIELMDPAGPAYRVKCWVKKE